MIHRGLGRRTLLCGLSATLLAPASRALASDDTAFGEAANTAARLDQLHAMVVAHKGEVVFARAFRGAALDVPANVKSISKTIVALLTGIAIDKGVLPSVDAKIGSTPTLYPALFQTAQSRGCMRSPSQTF